MFYPEQIYLSQWKWQFKAYFDSDEYIREPQPSSLRGGNNSSKSPERILKFSESSSSDDKSKGSTKPAPRRNHSLDSKRQPQKPQPRRQLSLEAKDMEPCINRQNSLAAVPIAGALVFGTCLGGPVGLLAGLKIGALVGIGGSVAGYTTANKMEQHW